MEITIERLISLGLNTHSAQALIQEINATSSQPHEFAWSHLCQFLTKQAYPFSLHLFVFTHLFPNWHEEPDTAPAWLPDPKQLSSTNLYHIMQQHGMVDYKDFYRFSREHYSQFWQIVIDTLSIVFKTPPTAICNLQYGVESPSWLVQAKVNIADSCFKAPEQKTALIYQDTMNNIHTLTYHDLHELSNRIANSLVAQGFMPGDALAIAMPMNQYAIAIYLAIIQMGGVVVSIADSFSGEEIAIRLNIAKAKAIFTQPYNRWNRKKILLYEKIANAHPLKIILVPDEQEAVTTLRAQDIAWANFISHNTQFTSHAADPMHACNILFSSGTTAEPKAIVWNHTTAIKAASDGYFHQNIKNHDIIAWPSNLGWMMGPWLVFAGLINEACIAVYPFAPKDREFGEFIQNTKVTILGVVPTLVAAWRQTQCMEKLNWQSITLFTSTGECSNPEDMLYLMSLAGYKPVIEYCGGTEIGGAYITSTVIEKNYPSLFSTPALGLDFLILDEEGKESRQGEVALIPPSMGLSTQLLNADHHRIYYENMPAIANKILRRHGDAIKQLPNHYYILLGRADDSMKLGGIKISATEIERTITGIPLVIETAAIAVSENLGPSQLVIYAVVQQDIDKIETLALMQQKISHQLNPLFKIHDLILINELPKTASNKIMRRTLRKMYLERSRNKL